MTGLNTALLAGLSGMRTSQTGLRVASQNIANANTPGYVRTEVHLQGATLNLGGGVQVSSISRAANQFLARASYLAEAAVGAASARSEVLDRAQGAFGDPTGETTLFNTLDSVWSSLTEVAVDPSSTLRRSEVITTLESTFTELRKVASDIQALIAETDQRISEALGQAQSLLDRIGSLNTEIRNAAGPTGEASAAENAQAGLIDELSGILDINVTRGADGGVQIRTSGGALLLGSEPATLAYQPNSAPYAPHGLISFNTQLGDSGNLEPYIRSGEIAGLIRARDEDLIGIAEALGGFSSALADTLNVVHNENAAYPAASELNGRNTGLLATDSLNFTGVAIVGVVDVDNTLAQRLTIDFNAGTITGENPAAVYNFTNVIGDAGTAGTFVAQLNAALGASSPAGSADFVDGQLQIHVGPSAGLVVQQDTPDPSVSGDTATPSARAGRGFAHFFGLNDIVTRPTPMFFETGLVATDVHGLQAGGEMSYEIRDSSGRLVGSRTVSITPPLSNAGSTWGDLVTALNANGTGVGGYGSFGFSGGQLKFTPTAGYELKLLNDSTSRGNTGISVSSLHGYSQYSTAGRAMEADVNTEISANPGLLALGRPNMHAEIGDSFIEGGDNRGASALLEQRDATRSFVAAGSIGVQTTSISLYASRLGSVAGRLASDAENSAVGAKAVSAAAADRRGEAEGVNLDDELVRMTVFQNSYAAAARVIQAATDMLDILISLGAR